MSGEGQYIFQALGKEKETSSVRTFILLREEYIKLMTKAYVVFDRSGDFILLFYFQGCYWGSTAVAQFGEQVDV